MKIRWHMRIFFQFHIFFSAWPDIKTPSRKSFIICFDDIAFSAIPLYLWWKTLWFMLIERQVKSISAIQKYYKISMQQTGSVPNWKMRKLDSPDDVVAGWGRYSNFGPSNMQRTEDKNLSYGTLLEAVPGLLKLFSDKNRKSIKMYK